MLKGFLQKTSVCPEGLRTVVKFRLIGKLKQDNNLWNIPSTQLENYNIQNVWIFFNIKKKSLSN